MEKTFAITTVSGDGANQARPSGDGVPTDDNGGSDDPPPIPSAGSSSYMNEKFLDGARTPTTLCTNDTTIANTSAVHDVSEWAHTASIERVIDVLDADITRGLASAEAVSRREQYGSNALEKSAETTPWTILVRQVSNSLTVVLAIAMILSYATLDWIEGGVISAVIVLNIVVGFWQDYRAEQTIQSLLAMAAPECNVIREDGLQTSIKAEDLVVGDVVLLSAGDIVPADLRLVSSVNLATNESPLTGESKACTKDAFAIIDDIDAPVGDRVNMAYSSTTVTRGRATAVVVATAMATQVGKIAVMLRGKKPDAKGPWIRRIAKRVGFSVKNALGLVGTPSQVKLSYFGLFLFGLAILLAIIVFSTAKWDIDNETLIYGICVAVAVIPESLIAVVTITMAVGSKAMAKGNVIVRKMGALEAIGGVTNICSDKTGTLTQGKMLARKAWLPDGRILKVENETSPFNPTSGIVTVRDKQIFQDDVSTDPTLLHFFQTIALCNLASVVPPTKDDPLWSATGEPTEIALQVLGTRTGYSKPEIVARDSLTLATEHPFDSSIKRMSVVYQSSDDSALMCFTKGATEALLPLTDVKDAAKIRVINEQVNAMAIEGLRVLCLGYRTIPLDDKHRAHDRDFVEQGLTFGGLVGIYDPPRLESAGAIKQCQHAGITVHMLTGDHLQTATTIAKEIGILSPDVEGYSAKSAVMTASVFDKMSDDELDIMQPLPLVLARCTPATKLRMLHALHRRGKYCVMTGDGVNDSPALKGADVGVAMGLNGSDVSKEAADMVLTDDNFASIVSAIREGRRLFDNIQKFLLHLLVSNIAQVVLLLIGLAFKDERGVSSFPLSPLEILFANLITSSFLAIGLGLEEPSADVMFRPPRNLKIGVFTKELIVDKFVYGAFMGALCLASYCIVAYGVGNGDLGSDCNHAYNDTCGIPYRARGTAYCILTWLLSVMAWEAKHLNRSLFNMYPEQDAGAFSIFRTLRKNRFLFWAVCAGFVTPFAVVYIPVINRIVFRHSALTWEWGLVAASLVLFVAWVESWKAIKRRLLRKEQRARAEGIEKTLTQETLDQEV